MSRRSLPALWIAVTIGVLAAPLARAAEPKCPLELSVCLAQYELMKERPWLGVTLEPDSATGAPVVRKFYAGSPAQRSGLKVGDMLESIGGQAPRDWFAGKAGWKTSGTERIVVRRNGRERNLDLAVETIPEELFAKIVGTHMIEGHLAYMDVHDHAGPESR